MVPQIHTELTLHIHDHVTQKLGLTLQNQILLVNGTLYVMLHEKKGEDVCYGAGKGPYGHPSFSRLQRTNKI